MSEAVTTGRILYLLEKYYLTMVNHCGTRKLEIAEKASLLPLEPIVKAWRLWKFIILISFDNEEAYKRHLLRSGWFINLELKASPLVLV